MKKFLYMSSSQTELILSQKDIWQFLEIFLIVTTGGVMSTTSIQCIKARDIAKHSIMHRKTPIYTLTQERIVYPKMSIVPRLGVLTVNKGLKPNHILNLYSNSQKLGKELGLVLSQIFCGHVSRSSSHGSSIIWPPRDEFSFECWTVIQFQAHVGMGSIIYFGASVSR